MTPKQIREFLRHKLGLSHDEFADRLGYTGKNRRVTVFRIETGRTKPGGSASLLLEQLKQEAYAK